MTRMDTIHIMDAVSKTFHISDEEIVLHLDGGKSINVPEKYRKAVEIMVKIAEREADEITIMRDFNVQGSILGESAQRIWEELIS
jgi:hypothetical protein